MAASPQFTAAQTQFTRSLTPGVLSQEGESRKIHANLIGCLCCDKSSRLDVLAMGGCACYGRTSSTAKGEERRKPEEAPIHEPDALRDHHKYLYHLLCSLWRLFQCLNTGDFQCRWTQVVPMSWRRGNLVPWHQQTAGPLPSARKGQLGRELPQGTPHWDLSTVWVPPEVPSSLPDENDVGKMTVSCTTSRLLGALTSSLPMQALCNAGPSCFAEGETEAWRGNLTSSGAQQTSTRD